MKIKYIILTSLLVLILNSCESNTNNNEPDLSGNMNNTEDQTVTDSATDDKVTEMEGSNTQLNTYKSDTLTFEYPNNYQVYKEDEMIIVSNKDALLVISGFQPSVGYPQIEGNNLAFQGIIYSGDKVLDPNTVVTAWFYNNSNTTAENDFSNILKSIQKL